AGAGDGVASIVLSKRKVLGEPVDIVAELDRAAARVDHLVGAAAGEAADGNRGRGAAGAVLHPILIGERGRYRVTLVRIAFVGVDENNVVRARAVVGWSARRGKLHVDGAVDQIGRVDIDLQAAEGRRRRRVIGDGLSIGIVHSVDGQRGSAAGREGRQIVV